MHQVEGANPSALTISFCPCGVAQSTCLPLMHRNDSDELCFSYKSCA
jgi:hypothetical protein